MSVDFLPPGLPPDGAQVGALVAFGTGYRLHALVMGDEAHCTSYAERHHGIQVPVAVATRPLPYGLEPDPDL